MSADTSARLRAFVALAVLVIFGVVALGLGPGTAAAEAPDCSSVGYAGFGTATDPYEISSLVQLQCIGANHYSTPSKSDALGSHYVLVSDIDASATATWNDGKGFEPIGTACDEMMGCSGEFEPFSGTFDGKGHTISELTIDSPGKSSVGPFGYVTGTIRAVRMEGVAVTADRKVGGLVGYNWGTVTESHVDGSVSGTYGVGGLVGSNDGGSVLNSRAVVSVTGTGQVGGLIGSNRGFGGEAEASFAAGTVSGTTAVGGLVGFQSGNGALRNSYWDTQATGQLSGIGAHDPGSVEETVVGLSTTEMTGAAAETNMPVLDFSTNWKTTDSYPNLQAFIPPAISNMNVANPAGQDVRITFDSDTQLANIAVTITGADDDFIETASPGDYPHTGAEGTTLTEDDFTEAGGPGDYTYTATYVASTGGTYTATINTAEDSEGNDGAGGESGSVTIDATPPSISNVKLRYQSASPPLDGVIEFSFESAEQLDTNAISASMAGAESATLTDFHEWDGGGYYVYSVRYSTTTDGTYTFTLDTAKDAAGNDGASGQSVTDTYDASIPTISNYAVTNPSERTIRISLTADETLSDIEVDVTGAEAAIVDMFTETANEDGTYTYVADYVGSVDGTYSAELWSAWDGQGNEGVSPQMKSVTVDTAVPTATAGSDQAVDEDTQVDFDGSGSSDVLGIQSYEWDFDGDGSVDATGVKPSHIYADPGTYTATLTVTDAGANTDADTLTVTVADLTSPVADAGSDRTVDEDTQVGFDGATSTDNRLIASYEWDFDGDGSVDATGVKPSHIYADPGTYTATLTVTDAEGNEDTDTLTATVADTTPPTAVAGPDLAADEDVPVTFDGTGSADNVGVVAYEWDFGDGTQDATGAELSHTYADPGTYAVSLTVTDGGGRIDTGTLTVTVKDTTPPTAVLGNDTTVRIGSKVDFDASNSTDNVGIVAYEWNFSDGANATGTTTNYTFGSVGTFAVTLYATDAAGNLGSVIRNVTVRPRPVPPAESPTDDRPTAVVTPQNETSETASNASVTNGTAGRSIVVDLNRSANPADGDESRDPARQNVSMSQLSVTVNSSEDVVLDVRTYDATEDESANERFLQETGATSAGYVVVNHSVSDDRITDATFTFQVRKDYFERTSVTADSVALYRNETERWRMLDTARIGETDTHYVFEATSPGLSVFVIGSTVPVFEPSTTDISAETVTVGEELSLTVAVKNRGGAAGFFDAELLVDGEPVVTKSVAVDAFGQTTVALSHSFEDSGTYKLTVGDRVVGTVTVETVAVETATTAASATTEQPAEVGDRVETATVETTTMTASATTEQPAEPDEGAGGSMNWVLVVITVLAVASGILLRDPR